MDKGRVDHGNGNSGSNGRIVVQMRECGSLRMHIDLLSLHSLTANYSSYTKWFGQDVLAPKLLH